MIEQFFRAWFNAGAQSSLLAQITGGVWPADAPPRTATDPYVTWQVIDEMKVQSFGGLSGLTRSLCSITAHSKTVSTAADLIQDIVGTKVAPKLIGYTGTISIDGATRTMSVRGVHHQGQRTLQNNPYEGSANSWYAKQLDVAIWWWDPEAV